MRSFHLYEPDGVHNWSGEPLPPETLYELKVGDLVRLVVLDSDDPQSNFSKPYFKIIKIDGEKLHGEAHPIYGEFPRWRFHDGEVIIFERKNIIEIPLWINKDNTIPSSVTEIKLNPPNEEELKKIEELEQVIEDKLYNLSDRELFDDYYAMGYHCEEGYIVALGVYMPNVSNFPDIITEFLKLELLSIYSCGMAEIPPSISKLSNLKVLKILWCGELMSLPDNIDHLYNLNELQIDHANLPSLPDTIGNLNNLRKFKLIRCPAKFLPKSIGNLSKLEELDLFPGNLTSLPISIGDLSNLQEINLESNKISTLPESIGDLYNLRKLMVADNKLIVIPSSICNLKNLEYLDLNTNRILDLPENIGDLKKLKVLYLFKNRLFFLPESICSLEKLEELSIEDNDLTSLPLNIGKLINLEYLDVNNNKLDFLPLSIGDLKNLERLDLDNNNLILLPPNIKNLINLQKLGFQNNHIPSLPNEIGKLKNLRDLDLIGNQLTKLPETIGKLKKLFSLKIKGNPLEKFPKKLSNLQDMYLDIRDEDGAKNGWQILTDNIKTQIGAFNKGNNNKQTSEDVKYLPVYSSNYAPGRDDLFDSAQKVKLRERLVNNGNWNADEFKKMKQDFEGNLEWYKPLLESLLNDINFNVNTDENRYNSNFTLYHVVEYTGGKPFLKILSEILISKDESQKSTLKRFEEFFQPFPLDTEGFRNDIFRFEAILKQGLYSDDLEYKNLTEKFLHNIINLLHYLVQKEKPDDPEIGKYTDSILEILAWLNSRDDAHIIDQAVSALPEKYSNIFHQHGKRWGETFDLF